MLNSKNGQSFDWQDSKGNIYPNDCPYFEGRAVTGYLNADNETTDYELSVYINSFGAEKTISVSVGELSNANKLITVLANKGLIIKPRNAKDASGMLLEQAQQLITAATVKHNRLGLTSINRQAVYLQEQNTVGTVRYIYDGKILLHSGSKQRYENFLRSAVFKSRNLTLAYMIGMSAPVMSLLVNNGLMTDKTNIVNFSGKSSTGKSTSARLAMSPFGNPSFGSEGLGITQTTTENAIYGALDGVNGLPRVLDDINQNQKLNIEQLIYSVVAGEPKRRLGKKYQGNGVGWSGTVIVTSETPIILETAQKGGVHARVLTLELTQWTSSKEEAETVSKAVTKNYGWTGQDFVEHLLNDSDYIQERFEDIRQEVDRMITVRDSLTDRISARIAAVALTADCYLRYHPNAFQWSYLGLIKPFIESEQRMVEERDAGNKILNLVKEYIVTNNSLFSHEYLLLNKCPYFNPIISYKPAGKIINYYDTQTKNYINSKVYIYVNAFNDLVIRNKIFDYKSGLQLLKERKLLKCDGDNRLQTKLEKIRAYCFIVELEGDINEQVE